MAHRHSIAGMALAMMSLSGMGSVGSLAAAPGLQRNKPPTDPVRDSGMPVLTGNPGVDLNPDSRAARRRRARALRRKWQRGPRPA